MESVQEKHMALACSYCLDRLACVVYNEVATETGLLAEKDAGS